MLLTKRQVKTVRLVAWEVEEAREGIEEKSPKWRRRKKSGLGEKKNRGSFDSDSGIMT